MSSVTTRKKLLTSSPTCTTRSKTRSTNTAKKTLVVQLLKSSPRTKKTSVVKTINHDLNVNDANETKPSEVENNNCSRTSSVERKENEINTAKCSPKNEDFGKDDVEAAVRRSSRIRTISVKKEQNGTSPKVTPNVRRKKETECKENLSFNKSAKSIEDCEEKLNSVSLNDQKLQEINNVTKKSDDLNKIKTPLLPSSTKTIIKTEGQVKPSDEKCIPLKKRNIKGLDPNGVFQSADEDFSLPVVQSSIVISGSLEEILVNCTNLIPCDIQESKISGNESKEPNPESDFQQMDLAIERQNESERMYTNDQEQMLECEPEEIKFENVKTSESIEKTIDETIKKITTEPVKTKSRWAQNSKLDYEEYNNTIDNVIMKPIENPPNDMSISVNKDHEEKCTKDVLTAGDVPKYEPWVLDYTPLEENLCRFVRKKCRSKKQVRRMLCDCTLTKEEIARGVQGCGDDCLNRLLMIECGSRCILADGCSNKRFQRREHAKTEPFKTEKKGTGLRIIEDVPAGHFVTEFVGEVLNGEQFRERVHEYAKNNTVHHYFMLLKSDEVIDATLMGNYSRYINHSCDPNCETQKWTINGELRIGFFTKCKLSAGDELTFDYKFQRYGREAQKCFCGTEKCKGVIGDSKPLILDDSRLSNRRKKLEDDEDFIVEEEIEKMCDVGCLRNKEDTLNLARLMVRVEDLETRQRILDVILNTSVQACLRLFLDYHGLSLFWLWMADVEDNNMKCKLLKALALLPIPNKTILLDSKVLNIVEKWSSSLEKNIAEKNLDSKENDNKEKTSPNDVKGGIDKLNDLKIDNSSAVNNETDVSANVEETKHVKPSLQTTPSTDSSLKSDEDSTDAVIPIDNDKHTNSELSVITFKLLDSWKSLKEEFRIPRLAAQKRKDDEAKADERNNSKTNTGVENNSQSRKYSSEESFISKGVEKNKYFSSTIKIEDRNPKLVNDVSRLKVPPNINYMAFSKEQRRNLFAAAAEKYIKKREKDPDSEIEPASKCRKIPVSTFHSDSFQQNVGEEPSWDQRPEDYLTHPTWCSETSITEDRTPILSTPGFGETSVSGYTGTVPPTVTAQVPHVPSSFPFPPPNLSFVSRLPFPGTIPPGLPPPVPGSMLPSLPPTAISSSGSSYAYNHSVVTSQQTNITFPPPANYSAEHAPPFLPFLNKPPPLFPCVPSSSASTHVDQESSQSNAKKPSSGPKELKLPKNWRIAQDSDGAIYYYHSVTRKTQWKFPTSEDEEEESDEDDDDDSSVNEQDSTYQSRRITTTESSTTSAQKINLPRNWRSAEDASGRTYFYHIYNREPQWDPPDQNDMDEDEEEEDIIESDNEKESFSPDPLKLQQKKGIAAPADTSFTSELLNKKMKKNFIFKLTPSVKDCLNVYFNEDCTMGRITSSTDFKYLARKLTHVLMLKELKHCRNGESIVCDEDVRRKAKDFIKKYMSKQGPVFQRGRSMD